MRNKLKRSKKDALCPRKTQPRTAEGKTVKFSESICSNDKTEDSVSPALKDKCGSHVAARKVKPLQRQRETFCAKGFKIAPIFLRTTQSSKRSGDGKLDKPAEKLQKSVFPPQTEDVQQLDSQQQVAAVSCRGQLSALALHSCLEEIQTSNRAFPVQAVFNTLLKKTSLQDSENSLCQSPLQEDLKEKRKREFQSTEREAKRLRFNPMTEGAVSVDHCCISAPDVQENIVLTAVKQPTSNKLSRTHRLRRQSGTPASLPHNSEPSSGFINNTASCSQLLKTSDSLQRVSSFEDVLWTDKYSPQHSSEVIGNSASVNKLQCWLKKWKQRADCDDRRKMEERKQEEDSNESWDCGDFQGEAWAEDDREEPLCNTMLITGAPGVGKTAVVYACSQELGFKVFEVNCSSQRSGCHVLSQLKEATQSHLVEMSGRDPLKPTYFNNYSSAPKSETLPGPVPPKSFPSTSRKRAAQKFGRSSRKGKANAATVTLASYFKMKARADQLHLDGLTPTEKPDRKTSSSPSPGFDQSAAQNKKTATSLILFEEVDVIFDDDVGFLAAIKTFMTTTKRPVILTTSDPLFRERFGRSLEEIIFKIPSTVNVCSYLQLVALAENVRLELNDIRSLLTLCRGDVRRCLLQLQLWVRSGGGRASQSGGVSKEVTGAICSSAAERRDSVDSKLPECDTGCTASMLGLHPVTQHHLLNLLKCQFLSHMNMIKLLRLLAESWRGGVPLLYSNLELLLTLGAKGTSVLFLDKRPCSGLQSEPTTRDHIQQLDEDVRPMSPATKSKSVGNISRLSRRKYIRAMSDTTSSVSLAQTPQIIISSSKRGHSSAPGSRGKTEQIAAKVATDCLDALTGFFDLMSYLDVTMPAAAPLVSGPCRPEAFVWSGAEIKDGLLDEMSEQGGGRSSSREGLLDFQAAVEGLGCHRCLWRVSEAWTEAQKYREELGDTRWRQLVERLLPASSKRQSLSFAFKPLCAPSLAQRRYELSRTVLSSKFFSLLGNRRAVSVDYMPVLRYICRSQRAQRQKEEPAVRYLKYLSNKHLGLSKSTIQLLAEDFS